MARPNQTDVVVGWVDGQHQDLLTNEKGTNEKGTNEKGTFYFSSFLCRPLGRMVDSRSSRVAVFFCQFSDPHGLPR